MKRFEEYLVKQILYHCYPDLYGKIEVRDKPDLWCVEKNIGIEVTNCTPQKEAESMNLWAQIKRHGGIGQERNIEHLKKNGYDYKPDIIWNGGTYSNDIDSSPIHFFLDAIDAKHNKLNSTTAKYQAMERYDLFVNSLIFIPIYQEYRVAERIFEKQGALQDKRFSTIYLLTNESKLVVFDCQKKNVDIKYLYGVIGRWINEAIKERRGETHVQT